VWHSNTVKNRHCDVFIKDSIVVFITQYHKGYNISSDVKDIHQHLPRKVSELVA
jgi:hypothetical protein